MKGNEIMKKTKGQKGITLVALIITVVVLLILVSVAINSIQNDGILSYAGNVANKYNQAQKDEQGVLDQYLDYLKGEKWVTVYEGRETTVDGFAVIANKHLFKAGYTYRVTVESDEFTGTVETVAVLYPVAVGVETYILFGVTGEQPVKTNSLVEYMEILENIPADTIYTVVTGKNLTDGTNNGNVSAIELDGTSDCEYKIIKIEEKVEPETDSFVVFEGSATVVGNSEATIVSGLKKEMSLKKSYRVDLIIDGQKISLKTTAGTMLFSTTPCVCAYINDMNKLCLLPVGARGGISGVVFKWFL